MMRLLRRLMGIARQETVEREMDEEMRFHIEMEAGDLEASGLKPEEARRRAHVRFGGMTNTQEAARDVRGLRWTRDFANDARYAMRMLRRSPVFTFAAVATIAIGVGASATIFGVADVYIFKPLPFPDGERLVVIEDEQGPAQTAPASYAEFVDWRTHAAELQPVVATTRGSQTWEGPESAERVQVARVSTGYFPLLGVRPTAGRLFTDSDHAAGAAPVIVVSELFWRSSLGGDPAAIGRPLTLNGRSFTVIGVVEGALMTGSLPAAIWTPLEPSPPWSDRGTHYLTVIGKLPAGVALADALPRAAALARRLDESNDNGHGIVLSSLRQQLVGGGRTTVLILLASVSFLLLIAMANLAGLLQARASARAHEYSLRAALGAGRGRLVRQTFAEVLLLAGLGAAGGVAMAYLGTHLLLGIWPPAIPRPLEIRVDGRVLAFAISAAFIAGMLAALSPELLRMHADALRSRGTTRARFRKILVAAEVALTIVMLVGAGLTLRSLGRIMAVDPGFQSDSVMTMRLSLPGSRYGSDERQQAFFGSLLERIEQTPGVRAAGAVLNLPLAGGGMAGDFAIQGRERFPAGERPSAEKHIVSSGYFAAMGIRLAEGRAFASADREGAPEVAIINQSMARRFFPDGNAIGQRLNILGSDTSWQEVVGIVADVRLDGLDRPAPLETYVPFTQWPSSGMTLVVRHDGPPEAVVTAARGYVREVDSALPIFAVQPLDAIVTGSTGIRRMPAFLLAAFAFIALVLAAVGLYGLLAFSVSQRGREIGVRMALGAASATVARQVLADGMKLVAFGAIAGVILALPMAQGIRALLFDVKPIDLVSFGAAVGLVGIVAALASWIPARRAARVDPMRALRQE